MSSLTEGEYVDIQNNLGDVSGGRFKFELYITSTVTPNYRYRIMFVQYGIVFYPVTLVLDEAIATELGQQQQIEIGTPNEFENSLGAILNSRKVENVITALLALVKKEGIPE